MIGHPVTRERPGLALYGDLRADSRPVADQSSRDALDDRGLPDDEEVTRGVGAD